MLARGPPGVVTTTAPETLPVRTSSPPSLTHQGRAPRPAAEDGHLRSPKEGQGAQQSWFAGSAQKRHSAFHLSHRSILTLVRSSPMGTMSVMSDCRGCGEEWMIGTISTKPSYSLLLHSSCTYPSVAESELAFEAGVLEQGRTPPPFVRGGVQVCLCQQADVRLHSQAPGWLHRHDCTERPACRRPPCMHFGTPAPRLPLTQHHHNRSGKQLVAPPSDMT